MKITQKILGLALACTMVMSLAACDALGGASTEKNMQLYIQGMLDKDYLGKYSKEYIDLVDATEEECAADYQTALENEAEYFAYVFNIDNYTDEMKTELVALYKEIYANAKYTVHEGTKMESGNYAVEVDVEPIDIMGKITDDDIDRVFDGVLSAAGITTDEQLQATTDEEYAALDAAYATAIIQLVRDQLPTLGYGPQTSVIIQIKDSGEYYEIEGDSYSSLDAKIMPYE